MSIPFVLPSEEHMAESRTKNDPLLVRFYPGEKEELAKFARTQGFEDLSSWVRFTLRQAAGLSLPDEFRASAAPRRSSPRKRVSRQPKR